VSLLPLFEDLENGVVDAMRFQVDFMSCLCGVNGFEENFTFHKLNILWLHYYFALPVMISYFFLLLCSDMVFNSSSLFMSISNLILNKYKYHGRDNVQVNLPINIHVGG